MATELIRTWELLADGRRRDTGVDERWDGTSGSYDVARPAAYKPSKDHAYWFGHGRGSTEAVTVPADEDDDRRPRRFFVAVASGRREPVYPPTPKKGPMATARLGEGRPFADGPSGDRDWMNPLKAKRPGTTVRTMTDTIAVGANAEMPAATRHAADRVAAEQPARASSDRVRAEKPASRPAKAADAKASAATSKKAKPPARKAKKATKARPAARAKAAKKSKPAKLAKRRTAKSKPAKRRTIGGSVRAKARPASKARAKAARGRAAKPASRKKAAARSRRPARR